MLEYCEGGALDDRLSTAICLPGGLDGTSGGKILLLGDEKSLNAGAQGVSE